MTCGNDHVLQLQELPVNATVVLLFTRNTGRFVDKLSVQNVFVTLQPVTGIQYNISNSN